jgi:nitrilase
MKKATVKAAAIQIAPVLFSRDGTTEKILKAMADAAAQGVEIAVFPETFVPYYPYFSFVMPPVASGAEHLKLYDQAVEVPGPVTEAISAAAKQFGMVVVLGVNERDHGSLYNAQLIFDATGELLLKRRKITPTYHERMIWGQGDGSGLRAVDSAVGRIGELAFCDHYNPLALFALMADH